MKMLLFRTSYYSGIQNTYHETLSGHVDARRLATKAMGESDRQNQGTGNQDVLNRRDDG